MKSNRTGCENPGLDEIRFQVLPEAAEERDP
jgi:hypothetical protein